MQDAPRSVVLWAWLRLMLGIIQMTGAAAGAGVLVTIGLHPVRWLFLGGATAAHLLSHLRYRGQSHPPYSLRGGH